MRSRSTGFLSSAGKGQDVNAIAERPKDTNICFPMDTGDKKADETSKLLDKCGGSDVSGTSRTNSGSESDGQVSYDSTIVFGSKMVKCSTMADELAATWGGRRSQADSGRLRRTQSWSGDPPDDVSSEIRILRER